MTYHIRGYQDSDLDALVALFHAIATAEGSERRINVAEIEEQILAPGFDRNRQLFVAEDGGKLVGHRDVRVIWTSREGRMTGEAVEIGPIGERDLDAAAEAIASGEVFQRYGMTPAGARDFLVGAMEQTVVARVKGEAVGVAIYWTNGRAPVPAYLRILAVREGCRGKGIGLALLQFVEEQAFRRGPNLFLCCVTNNHGARRFYERHGYREVGVLNSLIAAGIDEVLYRKTLGPIRGYVPQT